MSRRISANDVYLIPACSRAYSVCLVISRAIFVVRALCAVSSHTSSYDSVDSVLSCNG